AMAGQALETGLLEHLLEIGHAGKHRRNLLERIADFIGQQPRYRRLAGARGAPEDERTQSTAGDHAAQCAVRPEQMGLADHFVQRTRPQLVGQRPGAVGFGGVGGKEIGHGWRSSGLRPAIPWVTGTQLAVDTLPPPSNPYPPTM